MSTKRIVILILSIFLLVIIGIIIGVSAYVSAMLKPPASSSVDVHISIPQGSGSIKIASILEKGGLVRNANVFSYYLKWKKQGSRFQAGEYSMKPGISFDDIVKQLNAGETIQEEMIRLTIPEGYTISQIVQKIQGEPSWNGDTFQKIVDSGQGIHLESLAFKQIPDLKTIRHRLEGYLFPDTYEFKKGTTEVEVVQRMLEELNKKLALLPPDWEAAMSSRGLTFHQLLTVASLIEKEVAVDEERPLVASVIYNRLSQKMPLQIDATVQYLFDKPKDRLFDKDLQTKSPYNTYLNGGMPPGPIASPSLASIQAALYPADTKYMYYVTKKDGSKGHLFAETFQGHQKNIAASKQQTKD
jgi:UPF0755 protein